MKKSELVIIAIFIAVLAIIFLGAGRVDNAINSAFNPIDKTCSVDSDCDWRSPDCTSPCSITPANKNWNVLCPIPHTRELAACAPMMQGEMKCINNICDYVMNNTAFE